VPVSEDMTILPSPASLKRKIIVKAKKQPPAERESESESEEEEEAVKVAVHMKTDIHEVPYKIIVEFDTLMYFVNSCYFIEMVAEDFSCNFGIFWHHISENKFCCVFYLQ
jgi:hypothetical protein